MQQSQRWHPWSLSVTEKQEFPSWINHNFDMIMTKKKKKETFPLSSWTVWLEYLNLKVVLLPFDKSKWVLFWDNLIYMCVEVWVKLQEPWSDALLHWGFKLLDPWDTVFLIKSIKKIKIRKCFLKIKNISIHVDNKCRIEIQELQLKKNVGINFSYFLNILLNS